MPELLPLDTTNPWQLESSSVAFDNGRLRLRQDAVRQPDGQPGSYAYVELPWPVVAIVPVTDDGRVHLVRQWRYPWGRNSWEIPAGHAELREAPMQAARRELAEEVGIQAARWDELGAIYSSASIRARFYLYLARGLSPLDHTLQREGSELDMITCQVPLSDAIDAAMDGRIVHATTIVALLRAARRLGQ
jgi:8-oxo-dGTP pyrophosphatase MutT (NUDIX family)